MGDPKKQRRKYETPRHPWRTLQLGEELKLIGDYGLRSKKELWKYGTEISRIRGIARSLLARSPEDRLRTQTDFVTRLGRLGILEENATLDDVLDLEITDLLCRRLQSLVAKSGGVKSPHQARQLIAHGHVSLSDRAITVPSYVVSKDEEASLKVAVPVSPESREEKSPRSKRSPERPSRAAE
ncbi:MAG: 30S ribosomal protein S4 [archaeon]